MSDDAIRTLLCIVAGDAKGFEVEVSVNDNVLGLKKAIHEEIGDKDIVLWKVSCFQWLTYSS